ncbi:MAG: saccharopine dehydrogenase family protein [Bacteroidales bacterium]|jgi:saccharopine dehydrogenase (NAD+, L-lysine-forming)|nr:saccharopine dehydrogenase family protein [Bacteroidales bacterium]MDD3330552.1 saccharopine dehydrogenase family protein [Bacteroidales bacterium]MDD3691489.1 saccharopine dehydrogenase family protein [Bacteroidales bacterium]MDD4045074.1 saccharopine dehydrogenase family protein [Bacteroidales bacterium]MDD4581629.1 saccharopine dehydrogenase family protein [Bacteroidales bacterium]
MGQKRIIIIGAGGVGAVVAYKCASVPEVFGEILLASRTKAKCDKIAASIGDNRIQTAQVNADNVPELIVLIQSFKPDLVINVALPYQDLSIMEACLATKTHYLDTANYEPKEVAKFEYKWQWDYKQKFADAGIMAILGCGFDPGVTNIFTAYAHKHYFDEMHYLDIVDCNAGDHGKAFATNFNPEINIREITQKGKYWNLGKWIETEPMQIHKPIEYPNIGFRDSYLLFHEELESLVKHFPTLKTARFWMTFGQKYLMFLNVLQEIGMTSIKPIMYEGKEIVPLQFLKAVLPEPSSLGENYKGETSIGCQIRGIKDGKQRTYYIWNNCNHAEVYKECGAQAVSYTTGVPAMIGALMILSGEWSGKGVFNVEEFNPDPFMKKLPIYGLPWNEEIDKALPIEKEDFC